MHGVAEIFPGNVVERRNVHMTDTRASGAAPSIEVQVQQFPDTPPPRQYSYTDEERLQMSTLIYTPSPDAPQMEIDTSSTLASTTDTE